MEGVGWLLVFLCAIWAAIVNLAGNQVEILNRFNNSIGELDNLELSRFKSLQRQNQQVIDKLNK